MMFTVEEITIMKMYIIGIMPNRQQIMNSLQMVVPHFTNEELEMKDIIEGIIKKLNKIDDKSFAEINFSIALDDESLEE